MNYVRPGMVLVKLHLQGILLPNISNHYSDDYHFNL